MRGGGDGGEENRGGFVGGGKGGRGVEGRKVGVGGWVGMRRGGGEGR